MGADHAGACKYGSNASDLAFKRRKPGLYVVNRLQQGPRGEWGKQVNNDFKEMLKENLLNAQSTQ